MSTRNRLPQDKRKLKQVGVTTRAQWRRWLVRNHDREPNGIWLVFRKKATGKPSLGYDEAVEEALCFGWIDSIVKRIDEDEYCRKFTPRRDRSVWSRSNKARAEKCIKEGGMTEFGLAKIEAAKRSGTWEAEPRARTNLEIPRELSNALNRNRRAKGSFEKLAPTYRNHFIAWLGAAKKPETRARRLEECLALLASGKKLGLK